MCIKLYLILVRSFRQVQHAVEVNLMDSRFERLFAPSARGNHDLNALGQDLHPGRSSDGMYVVLRFSLPLD